MESKVFKAGVWSAAPTPFTVEGKIDHESIERLTEHHLRLGVKGVFLCGTSGEGPWMTTNMCREVVDATVKAAAGRMKVTVQVTDNSALRILDNIAQYVDSGVDAVIMAPPFFQQNASQEYLKDMFVEVIDKSPLPVGFYHRGAHSSVGVEAETVTQLMAHSNLILVKDSSGDKDTMEKFVAHAGTLENPPLLLDGDEFHSVQYLKAGYDGVLFGGGCFNACMSNHILQAAADGDFAAAEKWQRRMNAMMIEFFGGDGFPCWLAGQKQVLVELGVFSNNKTILGYTLTPECLAVIRATIEREKEFLLP
jgi:dihydrodipicolinate synthase/N-acetylneuraminate lyase